MLGFYKYNIFDYKVGSYLTLPNITHSPKKTEEHLTELGCFSV